MDIAHSSKSTEGARPARCSFCRKRSHGQLFAGQADRSDPASPICSACLRTVIAVFDYWPGDGGEVDTFLLNAEQDAAVEAVELQLGLSRTGEGGAE